jgi:hypothetical protein
MYDLGEVVEIFIRKYVTILRFSQRKAVLNIYFYEFGFLINPKIIWVNFSTAKVMRIFIPEQILPI